MIENVVEYFKLRGRLYGLLASVFYKESDAAHFNILKKYLHVFGTIATTNDYADMKKGLAILNSATENITDEFISEQECMFAQLFLSVGAPCGEVSVVPQESVYRSPSKLSMQEPRDEVLEIYYSEGVGKIKGFTEPDDHITAELSFMAHMSSTSADDIEQDNLDELQRKISVQVKFLNEHLLAWGHVMCADVINIAGNGYYGGVAYLLSNFLKYDIQFLEKMTELTNIETSC